MSDRRPLTLLKVELTIDDRWAVGTWAESKESAQLPVLLDPRPRGDKGSRPYLPGTSLTGSLRRHLGPELALRWLGPDIGAREARTGTLPEAGEARTGDLVVLGCLPVEAAVASRGATAVDLERGAAQGMTQRTEHWAEPTTVTLVLEHDGAPDDVLLEHLKTWRPVIGRARTSGMGQARVTGLRTLELDLADADQFTWWLGSRDDWLRGAAGGPAGVTEGSGSVSSPKANPGRLTWSLVVREPVHVGSGQEAEVQADDRKATVPLKSGGFLIIPGSSWKGVFRHRAQVILAAVGATETATKALVDSLFGAEGGRGRLRFRDSTTKVTAGDPRTHVAIDRFTGGARTGALHRVLAIPEGTKLTLAIDAPDTTDAVANLLEHIVTDLHDGLITVGGHGTRGYGWVKRVGDPARKPRPVSVPELLAACGLAVTDAEEAR